VPNNLKKRFKVKGYPPILGLSVASPFMYDNRGFLARLLLRLFPPSRQLYFRLVFDLNRDRQIGNNVLAGLITASRCPRRYRVPPGPLERMTDLNLGRVAFASASSAIHAATIQNKCKS
jgi:hypothetical protein